MISDDYQKTGDVHPAAAEDEIPEEQGVEAVSLFFSLWRHRGALLACLDAVTIISSFLLAYYLRFHAEFLVIKHVPVAAIGSYLKGAVLLVAIWGFFIWRDGGYESGLRGVAAMMLRVRSLLLSGVYALAALMVISYMYRGLLLSRQVYLMTGVFASATMILLRFLFRAVDRDLASQGIFLKRIVVAGMSEESVEFCKRIRLDGGSLRVVGFLRWEDDENKVKDLYMGYQILGKIADVRSLYSSTPFDKLVISPSQWGHLREGAHNRHMIELVNFCEAQGVSLYMLSGSLDIAVTRQEVGSLSGVPIIRLQDASLHTGYAAVKRMMDLCGALVGIVAGMPLWILIGCAIKLTSRGPVFFVQTRAGLYGRPFKIYKFRTMVVDAEQRLKSIIDIDGLKTPGFKIKNDPRVTRLGHFLRRASLDEIPQLINVLKGQMSLIGPRPEMPNLVNRYTPEHRRRLKAKPGITGYQQVMARGIPLSEGVRYDLIYLKHQSLLLDIYILIKTVVVVFRGSGITH